MRIAVFLALVGFLCTGQKLRAQEPYFVQYNKKNKLDAPLDFYHAFQDKDGFVWMCGPTGISRFNGQDFEHFSRTSEGLAERGHIKGHIRVNFYPCGHMSRAHEGDT